ncbi:MAG: ABC transporter permease [Actinobacteria bacterium]|nr:ABC transporter permease [Actinomycetota bacterium]
MNTWSLSWHGLRTVVSLELRQRIRSPRWMVALAAWFVLIGGITGLVIYSMSYLYGDRGYASEYSAGPLAFGIITMFVLGMGLMIAPAFTSTSINGDRSSGTLATLQATRLSAFEIAAGKLIAAWLAAAVFLVVALPFIVWTMVLGWISIWQVAVCFAVVFALVAVVCAIGLGWSALIQRTAGATVMTYLSVVLLSIISPMVMVLSMPFTLEETTYKVWGLPESVSNAYYDEVNRYWEQHPDGDGSGLPAPPVGECTWTEQRYENYRTDRLWWLLVPNPFVIVADAAPLPDVARDRLDTYVNMSSDPLAGIRLGVRSMAIGPELVRDDCIWLYNELGYNVDWNEDGTPNLTTQNGTPVPYDSPVPQRTVDAGSPVWPWGLGVNLAIGVVFFWVAVRRLAIPYGVLPRGVRVA